MQMLVGTTAVSIGVSNRTKPVIQNLGPGKLYIGDSTVTAGTGFQVPVNGVFSDPDTSFSSDLYLIADAANTDVRILSV